ncbi:MAG: SpoIIIAH-like family protein [Tissierellaceae bacterium]|jgi:stage III sporulation protein AH|nr:SpoIIIAH-like family protein [Tissierellia bacterium]
MFKIKRPAIIGILLILLVFTGYLNYQFTQQALRKTSKDYQRYEASERDNFLASEGRDEAEDNKDEEIEIVDSGQSSEDDVAQVVSSGNKDIKEQVGEEASNLNIDYFVEHRLSRDKLRANLIDRLVEIVDNDKTDDAKRAEAQEEIMEIGRISETELRIEGLVKSKGFEEVLVLLTDEDIKVVVSTDELTETDMVKILDIVKAETDFEMDSIKIMKKQ